MKTPDITELVNTGDGKSQALAISVSILLLLSVSVISLSFWNAYENSHDAIAINMSGRQRMLTQRIEKNLLKLKIAAQNNADLSIIRRDILQNYQLFDQTLTALKDGELTEKGGTTFRINASQSIVANDLINQAKYIWAPMQAVLQPVISEAPTLSNTNIDRALFLITRDNQMLLELMDSLTDEIENAAHTKSEKLRIIEMAALGLILVNFGFVLFYFRRQLRLLSESKSLSMRILEQAGTAIIVINTNADIELCNHAAMQMFGYNDVSLSGENLCNLLVKPYFLQIGKRVNGEQFTLDIDLNEIQSAGRKLFITCLYDKSEQNIKEEKLAYLAYHDPLTELPNRMLFMDRLEQTLARAHRNNELATILFIDLDRFKQVNDSFGHAVGDLLLQNVASRLKECLREGDTLARLAGDEFTMIIEASEANVCVAVTKRILSELSREFLINGNNIQISGSIGASLYPNDSNDIHALLHQADVAMYQAKAKGGNTCCKYPDIPSA